MSGVGGQSMVRIWVPRSLRYYLELVNYQRVASPLETSMVCIRVSRALKVYLELNYQRVAFSYRVCLQRVAFSLPSSSSSKWLAARVSNYKKVSVRLPSDFLDKQASLVKRAIRCRSMASSYQEQTPPVQQPKY